MSKNYKSIIREIDEIHNIKRKLNNRENSLYKKIEKINNIYSSNEY